VLINGSASPWEPVQSGVPQGTVLGPLLFLLYVNNITDNINSEVRLFADDCVIYRVIKSNADRVALQQDLDMLVTWADRWQMKFNISKCHIIHMSRKRHPPHYTYYMKNLPLSVVQSYPYLGVTISSDLRWREHIDGVAAKANRILGLLRRNIRECPIDTKSLAYKSLVLPILEYASAAWDPYRGTDVQKLEQIQRRAARFVHGDYRRTSSVSSMISKVQWAPLATRRMISRQVTFYKALHGLIAIPTEHLRHSRQFTRSSSSLTFINILAHSDVYKYSYFPRTVKDWNDLPSEIRVKPTLSSFKDSLTKHYY